MTRSGRTDEHREKRRLRLRQRGKIRRRSELGPSLISGAVHYVWPMGSIQSTYIISSTCSILIPYDYDPCGNYLFSPLC